ncbi:MAG: YgjV family protein [Clostridia bacterium]|nr:YgjV family protein [Clostridia bacterium]
MDFILIQLIGGIGYAILSASYYKKEKKEILFMQIIAYIMFTIHYYLLSGITGAICNLIGLFALITIYLFEKYKWKKLNVIAFIFILLLMIINIISFQNVYSIFPLIASVIVIISFLMSDENYIRGIGLISAVCWLIYAIAYNSYISIIFEIVTLIGVIIAFSKNIPNKNYRIDNK